MGPWFSSCCSTDSNFHKLLFGESLLAKGIWRCFEFRITGCVAKLWWMSFFLWRVFVYDSHYPFQCISPLHSMLLRNGLLVIGQNWFIHLPVMEFFLHMFCFVQGLARFLLKPQVRILNETPGGHNEVPATACELAACLRWHLFWAYPSHKATANKSSHVPPFGSNGKNKAKLLYWKENIYEHF